METKDYWIYKNKIFFKPNFNDKLDNYIDIISKYNELIFSNYNDCSITIKTNNIYCNKYKQNYKESNFNQQVIIPQNITHLTFGNSFNKKVNKFPLNLKTIKCNKQYKYINDFKDKFDIIL